MTCGVCGGGLENVQIESESEIDRDQMRYVRTENIPEHVATRKIDKQRVALTIAETALGSGGLVGGLILTGQGNAVLGLVAALIGVILITHAISMPHLRTGGRIMRR